MSAEVITASPKRVSFGNGSSLVETWIIEDFAMPAEERQFYQDTILKKSSSMMSSSSSSTSGTMAQTNQTAPPGGKNKNEVDETTPTSDGKPRQNGTKEVHRVTFAESHTEHVSTEPNGSVIRDSMLTTTTSTLSNDSRGYTHNDSGYHRDFTDSSHMTNSSSADTPHTVSDSSPMAPMPGRPIIRIKRTRSQESHDNPFQSDGVLSQKADYIISHSRISRTEVRIADPDAEKEEPVVDQVDKTESAPVSASPPNRPNEINVKENGKVEEPVTPQSVEVKVDAGNVTKEEPQTAEQVKLKEDKKCKCCVIM